ncbi:DUF6702 family protein [Maribacter arenosus]|uniref:Peptidase E n=1 Tax=Maribacter arenosus TaxID=1854708 RepID=A0ABR7VIF6_9FLAO|nr:DUF6702 family protein [Maribacter arenosus]MBD0852327.1 hypothetical protein [Maribacter arenosus]
MKFFKKSLLLLVLPGLAFSTAHKFYVSVTNINYSEKTEAIQITSRVFIDDFEDVLFERYGIDSHLATDMETELANEYIEKYFKAKFLVHINRKQSTYTFLGKKYDNDVMICYMEIPEVDGERIKSITVQNEILTDLFEEQQNVVHLKVKGKKKSFVLIKENNKGMLNL